MSDVAWLRTADTHLTRKAGWIHVGHKGGKTRDIDLANDARRALEQYLAMRQDQAPRHGQPHRQRQGPPTPHKFVFISQRRGRLTEAGIHHW